MTNPRTASRGRRIEMVNDNNTTAPDDWESMFPTLDDAALDSTTPDEVDEQELTELDRAARTGALDMFGADDAPQPHDVRIRMPEELAAASNEAKAKRDAQAAAAAAASSFNADPFEELAAEVDEGMFLVKKTETDDSITADDATKRSARQAKRERGPKQSLLERARMGRDRDRGDLLQDRSFYMRDFGETQAGVAVQAATTTGELLYGYMLQVISTVIAYPAYRAGWWLKHWGREPILKSEYNQFVLGGKSVLRLYGKWLTMLGDMLSRTVDRVKAQRRATLEAHNLTGLDARGVVRTISQAIPVQVPADTTTKKNGKQPDAKPGEAGLTEDDKQMLDIAADLDSGTGNDVELVKPGTPFTMNDDEPEADTTTHEADEGGETNHSDDADHEPQHEPQEAEPHTAPATDEPRTADDEGKNAHPARPTDDDHGTTDDHDMITQAPSTRRADTTAAPGREANPFELPPLEPLTREAIPEPPIRRADTTAQPTITHLRPVARHRLGALIEAQHTNDSHDTTPAAPRATTTSNAA